MHFSKANICTPELYLKSKLNLVLGCSDIASDFENTLVKHIFYIMLKDGTQSEFVKIETSNFWNKHSLPVAISIRLTTCARWDGRERFLDVTKPFPVKTSEFLKRKINMNLNMNMNS